MFKTSELPFELAPEIKHWIECGISSVSEKSEGIECQILFPDKFIDRQSLLSIMMVHRVENQYWEIGDISVCQVINQGQSTKLIGLIDGESSEFNRIKIGFLAKDIIKRWQSDILRVIKYKCINDEQSFTSQHLKVIRSTGHRVVVDFEEQKPELCM